MPKRHKTWPMKSGGMIPVSADVAAFQEAVTREILEQAYAQHQILRPGTTIVGVAPEGRVVKGKMK